MRLPVVILAALVCAACGAKTAPERTVVRHAGPPPLLRVGVVGPLDVSLPRVSVTRGTLASVRRLPLVLVAAGSVGEQAVSNVAAANPGSHFALVGASVERVKQPNLVGVTFRETQAAELGGALAGYVVRAQGVGDPRVAWIGPGDPALLDSFRRGVHEVAGGVTILVDVSPTVPAGCKEAALSAILRRAVFVIAHGGLCGAAVAAAAADQNQVAASLSDFELPDAAVDAVVRSAVGGTYFGGEDVTFGHAAGAIGIRRLDPRVSPDVAVEVRNAAQALAGGRRPPVD